LEKIEMKKTLVAIAAMAAVTGAMAQATITGTLQVGTNRATTTTAGASTTKTSIDDSNGNTGVNVGVNDDLGNGMKFIGNIGLQVGINGSNGATTTGGVYETYGGLSGAFGTAKLGALQTPQFLAVVNGDAAGYLISNPVANIIQHQGGSVGSTTLLQSNSFQYVLPKFVDGLTLKYQNAMGEQVTGINGTSHYAADFTAGGFSAGYAYSTYKYTQTQNDTAQSVSGSYNFGPAKVVALWGQANSAGSAGVSGSSVGIVVPVGALSLMYNYGTTNGIITNGTGDTATARVVTTQKQSGSFAGASYSLSKRTTAYAAYYTESGNNGAGTVGSSSKFNTTRLMVIHSF
jgi:predicted porin